MTDAQHAESGAGICPTCGLTMSMFHPDHRADYEAGTPTSTLIEAVGRDAAVSILLWLTDIYDTHVLEYDDKLLSPSVEWLLQSVRDGLAGTCQCPIDAETGRVGRNPGCPSHGYTDHTPTEHIDGCLRAESPMKGLSHPPTEADGGT